MVSFSKAAAAELVTIDSSPSYFIGTIHSLCFRALGLSKSQVVDMKEFAEETGYLIEDVDFAFRVLSYQNAVSCSLEDSFLRFSSQCDLMPFPIVEDIRETYGKYKETHFLFDFDDMLIQGRGRVPKFDVVIVDEAQDLSPLQWEVVDSMGGQLRIVAGDDDQSIYSFLGASPSTMREIADEKQVLGQSYRVPIAIHRCAEQVISRIQHREHKQYLPTSKTGNVEFLDSFEAIDWDTGSTILVRDNYRLREIREFMDQLLIPYQIENGRSRFNSVKASIVRSIRTGEVESLLNYSNLLSLEAIDELSLNKSINPDMPTEWIFNPAKVSLAELDYLESVDLFSDQVHTLSTIHNYKGKEADNINLVLDCTEQVLDSVDSDAEFDNEVRVWYVGLTRAKESICLIGHNPYVELSI